jgi:hypothetical protein
MYALHCIPWACTLYYYIYSISTYIKWILYLGDVCNSVVDRYKFSRQCNSVVCSSSLFTTKTESEC